MRLLRNGHTYRERERGRGGGREKNGGGVKLMERSERNEVARVDGQSSLKLLSLDLCQFLRALFFSYIYILNLNYFSSLSHFMNIIFSSLSLSSL